MGSLDGPYIMFDIVWGCKDTDKLQRCGACRGITVGGIGNPGSCPPRYPESTCTMAYDIEVLQRDEDSLPVIGLEIASVSLACSCGYRAACYNSCLGSLGGAS